MSIAFVKKVIFIEVGENMQTTGTVLLNARGCNINGYDCFVNLSKDTNKEIIDTTLAQYPNSFTPSNFGVDSAITKISSCNLVFQNKIASITSNSISRDYYPEDFTVSCHIYFNITNSLGSFSNFWEIGDFGLSYLLQVCIENRKDTVKAWRLNMRTNASSATSALWVQQTLSSEMDFKNQWIHYALTRTNGISRMFINGTKLMETSGTSNNLIPLVKSVRFISPCTKNIYDDLVVIANQALWTSNFTPPSTYLLDSEYAMDLDQVRRRNIIAANVDKKLIIPDDDTFKQY